MPKQHRWVQHTVTPVEVELTGPLMGKFTVSATDDQGARSVLGCDDCGLPLTVAVFDEPCLSELEDEMEASTEEGD